MTLLIVDDQISVIRGIEAKVNFLKIGFDTVRTATNADTALDYFKKEKIDILLSDIEMPGKNGLELNKIVQNEYPDTLRIMLTSHADFAYAQSAVKLGCFDYIVQPAPADAIIDALIRGRITLERRIEEKENRKYIHLFKDHEMSFLSFTAQKLLDSNNKTEVEKSIIILNEAGYHISPKSTSQLILLSIYSGTENFTVYFSEEELFSAIAECLVLSKLSAEKQFLIIPLNCYIYQILLFGDQKYLPVKERNFHAFFDELILRLHTKNFSCYLGTMEELHNMQREIDRIQKYSRDNIEKKPGLYVVTSIAC